MGPRFDRHGQPLSTLPVELFETAIREARPFGLKRGVKAYPGGEPLLHPRFTRLLEIVRGVKTRNWTIETNGLLCTPEIVAEIAKSPDDSVSVSIEGTDAATRRMGSRVVRSFEPPGRLWRNSWRRPSSSDYFHVMRGKCRSGEMP